MNNTVSEKSKTISAKIKAVEFAEEVKKKDNNDYKVPDYYYNYNAYDRTTAIFKQLFNSDKDPSPICR